MHHQQLFSRTICKVECRFGAPMGRPDKGTRPRDGQKIYTRSISIDVEGYDRGGAYWGTGAPLYVDFSQDGSYIEYWRGERYAGTLEDQHRGFMEREGYSPPVEVIFRKYMSGEVIAIMPYIVEPSHSPYDCQAYVEVGQHTAIEYDAVIIQTEPASPEEYEELLHELRVEMNYNCKIIKKRMYSKYLEVLNNL